MARVAPRLSGRATNLSVLAALVLVFATGLGAVATGSPRGRWIVIGHGLGAFALIFLIPWKSIVVRRGWLRARATRWASLALVVLVLAVIVAGLSSATGLVVSVGGFETLWWHIAIALGLVPLLLFHLVTRPVRIVRSLRRPGHAEVARRDQLGRRRTQLNRRAALRLGTIAGLAAAAYPLNEVVLRVAGAPGGRRRFTGSHEVVSADPAAIPATIWLDDEIPIIDVSGWRLTVVDGTGRRELGLSELARHEQTVRAVLDCTSGWYAEHDWSGCPVSALVSAHRGDRSLYVHSVTGYWIRFPVEEVDELLLATQVSGQRLLVGHGYPLRLVAPGRRGYWWVKWVDRIELQATPAWWQPPFPVT
ncbi:MAG TPA: molybdopterin-dependent oxidoreductase [Micromonosporaceae bacterium]|jgi:DMSO/TMAO reductase YedYZ molybdopterin-dependent catalytic subunit